MSHLKYYNYAPAGQWLTDNMGYSQAVRVGDRIECSGQGGWKSTAEGFSLDGKNMFAKGTEEQQIDQAFVNVDEAVKAAGGKGWTQVFRVNTYHTKITPEIAAHVSANFKKWMPDHKPIWTMIGVAQLGAPDMIIEIEVVAHDPEGAAEAK